MREETDFENGRISDFQGLVTLTSTLDRVILHTVMHHSSTSTYIPNFIEIKDIKNANNCLKLKSNTHKQKLQQKSVSLQNMFS